MDSITRVQGDDVFTSLLDETSRQKARRELNELNDVDRASAVQTLRQWILEQDWLRTPTDFAFLLRFLRPRKFSQLETRKKLEKYWSYRSSKAEWFQNIDPVSDDLQTLLRMGVVISPLKRDKFNRRVVLVRLGSINLKLVQDVGVDNYFKSMVLFYDWLTMDEHVQVNGIAVIFDFTGFTLQTFLSLHKSQDTINFFSFLQNGLPARVKNINAYNQPSFFDIVYAMISPILSKKISSRVKMIGKCFAKMFEETGYECLPEEYLPDDYDGSCSGTTSKIIEVMIKDMNRPEVREYIRELSSPKYCVDKQRIPSEISRVSSYRKLCVD